MSNYTASSSAAKDSRIPAEIIINSDVKIYSNCYYAYVSQIVTKMNLPVGPVGKESEIFLLIDKANKLVYDFETRTYFDYKGSSRFYALHYSKSDTVVQGFVISEDLRDTARTVLKKSLPSCLSGKFLINDLSYGIETIENKRQSMSLKQFKASVRFDFEKEAKRARKTCIKKGKAIDLLF